MKTNRTVGMFMTRSRYVNSKANHPHWTHLFFSNLTGLLIMVGVSALLMGTANLTDPSTKKEGQKAMVFAAVILLIPLIDYVVTKLRKANGQNRMHWGGLESNG